MIAIIGTADMPSTEIIQRAAHAIQRANHAIQAWGHAVYAIQYNLFDIPAACYDPEEIAYLFKTYIRECDLKAAGKIQRPKPLNTYAIWSRIDQWDYG